MTKTVYKMSEVNTSTDTPPKFGIFITAISDEHRSSEVINDLYNKGIEIDHLLVINYFFDDENLNDRLSKKFPGYADSIRCINVNMYVPLDSIAKIRSIVDSIPIKDVNFGMDITCIPIPHFFIILKYLCEDINQGYLYYTEPRYYIMTDSMSRSYYSTSGSINTFEISGYSGIAAKSEPATRILLCFLGFDDDLLPTVIQDSSPSKIITINGFPSFFPKFKDISLINNEKILSSSDYANLRESASTSKNLVYVEASNPFDVFNTLKILEISKKEYCIDIVPLSSKPMALGACLFALFNEKIRVIYPYPEKYVSNITCKSKKSWEYKVDFQKLRNSEVNHDNC